MMLRDFITSSSVTVTRDAGNTVLRHAFGGNFVHPDPKPYNPYRCPTTQREHWQGYVEFKVTKRYAGAARALGLAESTHFEPRRGTPEQAEDYCTKEETRKPGTQSKKFGTRSRGTASCTGTSHPLKDALDAGLSNRDLWENNFTEMLRHNRAVDRYRAETAIPRDPSKPPRIYILTGPPGTGKSKWVHDRFPSAYWVTRPTNSHDPWWDQYHGQDVVVFDDFYGWIKYDMLLRICDRYRLKVPFKGGMAEFRATTIIFTSNAGWNDWYPSVADKSAWERRVYEYAWLIDVPRNGIYEPRTLVLGSTAAGFTRQQGDIYIDPPMGGSDSDDEIIDLNETE